MHGCFDKTIDLALARNFRLGGTRNIQFRIEVFNAFNAVVYNARNTTLQVTSPLVLTPSNPQYDASGNLVQTRLTPQNAGFGAATGAQNMRSMQAQIRFQFLQFPIPNSQRISLGGRELPASRVPTPDAPGHALARPRRSARVESCARRRGSWGLTPSTWRAARGSAS